MKKRKTVTAQRREALVRKKIEKRNARNLPDPEDVLDAQLKSIGIVGGHISFDSCGSTNDLIKMISQYMVMRETQSSNPVVKPPTWKDNPEEYLNQLLTPKSLPFILTAKEQTAGRGRLSNTWWTGTGSLALSMLIDAKRYSLNPQTSAQLSLATGFAAMQALRTITEETLVGTTTMPKIEIRWPNDVYVNDRKITGILIEAPNMHHIIIGIGVNTNNSAADAPEEIRDRIVTLGDVLGQKIDQNRFIVVLCREILEILNYFPSHLSQLIEKIKANLYQTGKIVNIARENEHITGQCLGLNADGSLRVLTESGEKAVVSGVLL